MSIGRSVLLVCLACLPISAEVRLPSLFSDGMVIQRNSNLVVWGSASEGEAIRVVGSWNNQPATTKADAHGEWSVELNTPAAGGPYTLTVAGTNTIEIKDVLSGEVWVCSGQSNMEWHLAWCGTGPAIKAEIDAANFPDIRFIDVPNTVSPEPRTDFKGAWRRIRPETAANFSAVAYYFGRHLHRELGIPIGLIGSDWGGTPAESWARADFLTEFAPFTESLDRLRDARENSESFAKRVSRRLAEWQQSIDAKDPGTAESWYATTFDDASWDTMALPQNWEDKLLPNFDGIVWYRRTVAIPSSWVGQPLTLSLGPIDDNDVTWVNGQRVGGLSGSGDWSVARHYTIPATATKSASLTIAIRVHDFHGGGGLFGKPEQLRISCDNEENAVSLAGDWKFHAGPKQSALPTRPSDQSFNAHTPTVLFNGMIQPLVRYRIAGAIWYQGESNQTRARQYRTLFPSMIRSWRAAWNQGDFPFYFVQIAPFRYGGRPESSAELREAQLLTLDAVPNTGMAVTMDIGNVSDIHPKNKVDVGERLARWALARNYGQSELVHSGPLYATQSVEPGRIRIHFDHVGGGLSTRDGKAPSHFYVAGGDRQFHAATARIDGDTLVVQSEKVKNPIAVRYAFTDTAEPNLTNREGLPASSFRTDDW